LFWRNGDANENGDENAQTLITLALTGYWDLAGNRGEVEIARKRIGAAEPGSFQHGHNIQGRALISPALRPGRQRLRDFISRRPPISDRRQSLYARALDCASGMRNKRCAHAKNGIASLARKQGFALKEVRERHPKECAKRLRALSFPYKSICRNRTDILL
jgi:hypothetical protein